MSTKLVITFSIIAVIFILVANFSFWLETQIFNRKGFARSTVKVMQREEVQDAIASEIVDKALEDQPIVRQVAGGLFESAIAGIIGAPVVEPVIEKAAEFMNFALTSKRPEEVELDISQIKSFLEPVLSNTELGTEIEKVKLPDKIVLFEEGAIPSFYTAGLVFLWVGPIAGIIGIGIVVALIRIAKGDDRLYVLRTFGYSLSIGALIIIILAWLFQAPILAPIADENLHTIASNIYTVFVGRYMFQNLFLILIGLAFLGIVYLPPYYRKRRAAGSTNPKPQETNLKAAS